MKKPVTNEELRRIDYPEDWETIELEDDEISVELPVLESTILLRQFVEELETHLRQKAKKQGVKATGIGVVIENSELLTEDEKTELLASNKKEAGRVEGKMEAIREAWKMVTSFTEGREQ